MYSFRVGKECFCGVELQGEGTVKVEGDIHSVDSHGTVTANVGNEALTLDYRNPMITCQACGRKLDPVCHYDRRPDED